MKTRLQLLGAVAGWHVSSERQCVWSSSSFLRVPFLGSEAMKRDAMMPFLMPSSAPWTAAAGVLAVGMLILPPS